MTDDEIYNECRAEWITTSGHNWTFDEFFSLLGYLEKDDEITLKSGEVVTGETVSYWYADWRSFSHGWMEAYVHLGIRDKQ